MCESSATLYRPKIGRDSAQGVTQDPFQVVNKTDVNPLPCNVSESGNNPTLTYMQRLGIIDAVLEFPVDPQCQANDYFIVTDRVGPKYYLVQGEVQTTGRGRIWQVGVKRVDQPT